MSWSPLLVSPLVLLPSSKGRFLPCLRQVKLVQRRYISTVQALAIVMGQFPPHTHFPCFDFFPLVPEHIVLAQHTRFFYFSQSLLQIPA